MRSVFGRAAVAAGAAAVVVVLGGGVGAAVAMPRPAVLAFHPAPFDYGQIAVGQRAARTFTLANTGGRASGALRVTVSGAAAFAITADTCRASLAPGKACTVRVRFAPARGGTVTTTLRAVGKNGAAAARDALAGTGQGLGGAPGHIYWAGDDAINTATLPGAGSPHGLVFGQGTPWGVAVDGSHVYWANEGSGTIDEAALTGGAASLLVRDAIDPAGVAVDASHIYWANFLPVGTIMEADLPNGGNPHSLVSEQGFPAGVAVDAGHIYWANQGAGTIMEADLPNGGNPHALVSGQDSPAGVAVDSGHIYWANLADANGDPNTGTINEASLPNGGAATPLVKGQNRPVGVAVDSGQIYWANEGSGTIDEAPLTGGTATLLIHGQSGQNQPAGVAVGP